MFEIFNGGKGKKGGGDGPKPPLVPVPDDTNIQIAAALRDLADLAERGHMRGVAIVALTDNGGARNFVSDHKGDKQKLLGALHIMTRQYESILLANILEKDLPTA